MAVRSSMAYLITKVRVLIGDPVAVDQRFSDDDIQDALDNRRRDVSLQCLTPVDSMAPGGVVTHLTYFSRDGGWWEDDVVLQDGDYETLPADTENLVVGEWTFSTDQDPPVYLTGRQYDINGAAADLIDAWLASVTEEVDFLHDNSTFKLSQQVPSLKEAAARYRRRQWVGVAQMVRTDEYPGWY